jgi:CPA2 family monovalent cation:H+ antiporter-2
VDHQGRVRSAAALVARGEFSIIIAGLSASLEPRIGPFPAAYVLMLAVVGPLLTRAAK